MSENNFEIVKENNIGRFLREETERRGLNNEVRYIFEQKDTEDLMGHQNYSGKIFDIIFPKGNPDKMNISNGREIEDYSLVQDIIAGLLKPYVTNLEKEYQEKRKEKQ